jgi:hypothetical protein
MKHKCVFAKSTYFGEQYNANNYAKKIFGFIVTFGLFAVSYSCDVG